LTGGAVNVLIIGGTGFVGLEKGKTGELYNLADKGEKP
jgi:hypothetical protein